jgi:acetyl-CoA carboxylase biotin carboxyl carrier protein
MAKRQQSDSATPATGGISSSSEDVFDVGRVRRLVELMQEFDLAEVDLRQADQRIRLRKDQDPVVVSGGYATVPQASPSPAAYASQPAPATSAAEPSSADPPGVQYITSPMVGTFYSAASPDAPAFVKVGDQVGPDSVVCIVEAMKVFNEIPAECSGKITALLVENGAAVEYGQKLFRVDKGG